MMQVVEGRTVRNAMPLPRASACGVIGVSGSIALVRSQTGMGVPPRAECFPTSRAGYGSDEKTGGTWVGVGTTKRQPTVGAGSDATEPPAVWRSR